MAWHLAVNNENYTNLALKIIERKMAWHSAVNNENNTNLAVKIIERKMAWRSAVNNELYEFTSWNNREKNGVTLGR